MADKTISAQIYADLRQKITSGVYSPSQSLIESALAEEYNVSRNTIKKAILLLEQDGLVTVEANKSAQVRSFSREELIHYLELRRLLEGYILKITVPYFDEADIAFMQEILDQMRECKDQGRLREYSENNHKFHNRIYDRCPNTVAVDVMRSLRLRMVKYNTRSILIPGRAEESFREHSAILDVIKSGDAEKAASVMEYHISNVLQEFIDHYELLV